MQLRIDSHVSSSSQQFEVRIISRREDPYVGLKGHDYIKARKLNQPVARVQTSAHANDSEVTK